MIVATAPRFKTGDRVRLRDDWAVVGTVVSSTIQTNNDGSWVEYDLLLDNPDGPAVRAMESEFDLAAVKKLPVPAGA